MLTKFANENDIELQKISPLRPSSNPAKTFMRPLGKAMKIAHMNKHLEKDTVEQLLVNYRETHCPATRMAPSAMLFRDDKQTSFPRQPVRKVDTEMARDHDEQRKTDRTEQINASKYRKEDVKSYKTRFS